MRTTLLFWITLFISILGNAQVPQGISYQAVAFNTDGTPVVNDEVGVKLSILDEAIDGSLIYSETHIASTNDQGLITLIIGQGSPTTEEFLNIDWSTNAKFLKVEIDPSGGTDYTHIGTSQLLSVPYAMYSKESESAKHLLDPYISIYTSNSTVQLVPYKKYFITEYSNNVTFILPSSPNPSIGIDKAYIEIYVMQNDNNPLIITLDGTNSLPLGFTDENSNFTSTYGSVQTGFLKSGYNKIVQIGDYWMCGGFTLE